jgi:hypothetical protein
MGDLDRGPGSAALGGLATQRFRLPDPSPSRDTAWAMSEENVEIVRRFGRHSTRIPRDCCSSSGVPIDEKLWMAGGVRDGRVTWWRNFVSEAEALEAAGLRE